MWMSAEEIRSSYRMAKNKKRQRIILSQLNAVDQYIIDDILKIPHDGISLRKNEKSYRKWDAKETDNLIRCYNLKLSHETISNILERPITSISSKIYELRKNGFIDICKNV